MPNHLHLLFKQKEELPSTIKTIKGASAFEINKMLNRKGALWEKDILTKVYGIKHTLIRCIIILPIMLLRRICQMRRRGFMGYMGNELYATEVASPLSGAAVLTADKLQDISFYATKVASPIIFGASTSVVDKHNRS